MEQAKMMIIKETIKTDKKIKDMKLKSKRVKAKKIKTTEKEKGKNNRDLQISKISKWTETFNDFTYMRSLNFTK